jgi:hypothetical protein
MAAGVLQKPGSKLGPCKTACKHRDCSQTKGEAAAPCRLCQKPIGYGVGFYRSRLTGELAHAMCFEEAVEKNDARVGLF